MPKKGSSTHSFSLVKNFIKNNDISAESYFEGSWSVFSGEPVEVVALFKDESARVIATSEHHKGEKIEELDNGYLKYTVTTNGLEEIQRWIIGFGDSVEVLAPQELKDSLSKIGEYLTQAYHHD